LAKSWRVEVVGRFRDGRVIYRLSGEIPALGHIAIGVIDRGTNVLQVRPTTICPQRCVFCSVDAGLTSRWRWAEYIVDLDTVVKGVERVVEEKGCQVEVLLDTVGDVLTYPHLVDLIRRLMGVNGVKSVALETHGLLLTKSMVDKLASVGLDRVNLSIDTLNPEKARFLYGTPAYRVDRVIEVAEYLVKETPIDLHVTPLWIPGVNDEDVEEVVNWAVRIGAGKRWPPVTVQKFVKHKYGRGCEFREVSWSEFWSYIEKLERKLGVRLRWRMEEWGMHYARRVKNPVEVGDLVVVDVISRGWLRGEFLGLVEGKCLLTLTPRGVRIRVGERYLARVTRVKDTIYIAEVVGEHRAK
jgi:uncharacterized Fe-S cluster-containing radical SAM superfamily enzyme